MNDEEKGWWTSKRFWVTTGLVLLVIFKDHLGIMIDPQEILAIVIPISALILGDSQRGIGVRACPRNGASRAN